MPPPLVGQRLNRLSDGDQSQSQRVNAVVPVETDTPLLFVLRNDLGLNGAKFGCGLAQCGALHCAVDGRVARSCVTDIGAISLSTRSAFGPHSGNLPQGSGARRSGSHLDSMTSIEQT
jgi:hypothetical protein